jgi:hypothetical protein
MRDCNDEPIRQQFDFRLLLFKTECRTAVTVQSIVKRGLLILLAGMLLAGCATNGIESRKKERAAGYAALSPEVKALVADGQIRRGMTEDAVYIAWGKPAQILQVEDAQGLRVSWIYTGGWLEETRYWYGNRRVPQTDYQPRSYVKAEIVFTNGLVESWQTLPQPVY